MKLPRLLALGNPDLEAGHLPCAPTRSFWDPSTSCPTHGILPARHGSAEWEVSESAPGELPMMLPGPGVVCI